MVDVIPEELDGYADQLHRNADRFSTIGAYATSDCRATDGMTGILALCQWSVEMAADNVTNLCDSARVELFQVRTNLKQAADDYRDQDDEAAEMIFTAYAEEELPAGYTERDVSTHSGEFDDPFELAMTPAQEFNEFEPKIEEAKDGLGKIESWTKKYTGISIAENVLGPLVGNWDALLENASGYEQLASDQGIEVLKRNIEYGMDSVSSGWNSEASTAFDFLIRGRWLPALDAFVEYCVYCKDLMEVTAQGALTLFDTLVIAIIEAVKWIPKKLAEILKLAKKVALFALKSAIGQLVSFVLDLWGTLKNVLTLLEDLVNLVVEYIEAASGSIETMKNLFAGDFAPLTSG